MNLPGARSTCWVDGQPRELAQASLAIDDMAVQAGLGVFETLALRRGKLLELGDHLSRLAHGATSLQLPVPPLERIGSWVAAAAASLEPECSWVKVIWTAGGRCFVYGESMDPQEVGRGTTAVLLPWRRNLRDPLTGLKSLSYAPNVLGLAAARRRGADEGLWLNTRGHLAEGCTSNLFVVHGGKLFTPGCGEGILPGIVRGVVLQASRNLGIPVHEGKVRLKRLERAREAFLTSSLRAVRPLVTFEGRPVGRDGAPGPITRRIAAEVDRIRLPGPEAAGSSRADRTDEREIHER